MEIPPATLEWIEGYGVDSVVVEKPSSYNLRPLLRETLASLNPGDEFIIVRFSNVVSTLLQVSLLTEYCRLRGIRLVSVEDRFDSRELLFGVSGSTRIMQSMMSFPLEVLAQRSRAGEVPSRLFGTEGPQEEVRRLRDFKVLGMYMSGLSVSLISKKSGLTHAYIYRILKRNGIKCDRYRGSKSSKSSPAISE